MQIKNQLYKLTLIDGAGSKSIIRHLNAEQINAAMSIDGKGIQILKITKENRGK